jgi:DNA-binding transcriptional regulator YiaG
MRQEDALRIAIARRLAKSGEARALRQKAGLTLAEVAAVCGTTAPTVWRWETGKRVPKTAAARMYGEFLERLVLM